MAWVKVERYTADEAVKRAPRELCEGAWSRHSYGGALRMEVDSHNVNGGEVTIDVGDCGGATSVALATHDGWANDEPVYLTADQAESLAWWLMHHAALVRDARAATGEEE